MKTKFRCPVCKRKFKANLETIGIRTLPRCRCGMSVDEGNVVKRRHLLRWLYRKATFFPRKAWGVVTWPWRPRSEWATIAEIDGNRVRTEDQKFGGTQRFSLTMADTLDLEPRDRIKIEYGHPRYRYALSWLRRRTLAFLDPRRSEVVRLGWWAATWPGRKLKARRMRRAIEQVSVNVFGAAMEKVVDRLIEGKPLFDEIIEGINAENPHYKAGESATYKPVSPSPSKGEEAINPDTRGCIADPGDCTRECCEDCEAGSGYCPKPQESRIFVARPTFAPGDRVRVNCEGCEKRPGCNAPDGATATVCSPVPCYDEVHLRLDFAYADAVTGDERGCPGAQLEKAEPIHPIDVAERFAEGMGKVFGLTVDCEAPQKARKHCDECVEDPKPWVPAVGEWVMYCGPLNPMHGPQQVTYIDSGEYGVWLGSIKCRLKSMRPLALAEVETEGQAKQFVGRKVRSRSYITTKRQAGVETTIRSLARFSSHREPVFNLANDTYRVPSELELMEEK